MHQTPLLWSCSSTSAQKSQKTSIPMARPNHWNNPFKALNQIKKTCQQPKQTHPKTHTKLIQISKPKQHILLLTSFLRTLGRSKKDSPTWLPRRDRLLFMGAIASPKNTGRSGGLKQEKTKRKASHMIEGVQLCSACGALERGLFGVLKFVGTLETSKKIPLRNS